MNANIIPLVNLLVEPFQKPTKISDHDCILLDRTHYVWWYGSSDKRKCVMLTAFVDAIELTASIDDGGPCPPSVLVHYSPRSLELLLKWLNLPTAKIHYRKIFNDLLNIVYHDGSFNQSYESDRPKLARHIFCGLLNSTVWHEMIALNGLALKKEILK